MENGFQNGLQIAPAIRRRHDIFPPELRHLLGRACRIGRRREWLADPTLRRAAQRPPGRTHAPEPSRVHRLKWLIPLTQGALDMVCRVI